MLGVFENETTPETTSVVPVPANISVVATSSTTTTSTTCALSSRRSPTVLFHATSSFSESFTTVEEDMDQSMIRSASSHSSIRELIHKYVTEHEAEDAMYIADLGNVVRQHRQWTRLLPTVEPFYAIKCNSDPYILKTLAMLGSGFDCASKGEIDAVLQLGVTPDRIIFANPCKPASHIAYARSVGVRMMTFDNAAELMKVKTHYPTAELVLRILTDDSKSSCRFGVKFGTHPGQTMPLLQTAMALGLNVIGVSFHVGSGCFDASAYESAVQRARYVFDEAAQVGYNFRLLDIGGGFPGSDASPLAFTEITDVLTRSISALFPPEVRVIAEPGRYYACGVLTLAVHITSRRPTVSENGEIGYMYYVNDGVYGSFNCLLFDHAVVHPDWLVKEGRMVPVLNNPLKGKESFFAHSATQYKSSIWGPTCDSMDCITKDAILPELDVGDWLLFEKMGAYTVAASSTFNGFLRPRIQYVNTEYEDLRPFAFD